MQALVCVYVYVCARVSSHVHVLTTLASKCLVSTSSQLRLTARISQPPLAGRGRQSDAPAAGGRGRRGRPAGGISAPVPGSCPLLSCLGGEETAASVGISGGLAYRVQVPLHVYAVQYAIVPRLIHS